MLWRKISLDTYPPFEGWPVRHFSVGSGTSRLAVHVSGKLDGRRLPIICLAAYLRNMADYFDFARTLHNVSDPDWPVVLIDFQGRGRSRSRKAAHQYTSVNDAADVYGVCTALGIEHGVFIGQGHGGQVLMTMAEGHQHLIAGAVLVDAGPIIDTPGLVRMRDNFLQMNAMRGERPFKAIARQVYGLAHPGATNEELDTIAARAHIVSKRGVARPLFDRALLKRLVTVHFDDVFEPQWPLFDLLKNAPLMLIRTQLTDSLQRATFDRMAEIRSDAIQIIIPGQGTPALLAGDDEVGAIADFAVNITAQIRLDPIVAG